MLTEKVKELIISYVLSDIKDAEYLVTVFDHALDIPPVNSSLGKLKGLVTSGLEALSEAKVTELENMIPLVNKIEQFGKHILFLVYPEKLHKKPHDRYGAEKAQWELSNVLKQEGLAMVQDNFNLNSDPEKHSAPEKYIVIAYMTRNAESHNTPTMDNGVAYQYVKGILCAYCLIVRKYAKQIEKIYQFSVINQKMDLPEYLKKITSEYKDQRSVYVPLEWISRGTTNKKDQRLQVSQIIQDPNLRVKIAGQAGSGKTFFLKNLEYCLADAIKTDENNIFTIPVYIKLIDLLTQDRASLLKLFVEKTGLPEDYVSENMASNSFLLLLDGYDEISDREIKRSLAAQLDQLIRDGAQIIIADRAVAPGAIPLSNMLMEYNPQELSENEYRRLIENYCAESAVKKELLERLTNTPVFFARFKTPLQIRQLSEVCNHTGTVPESPSQFTDQYISFLLGREAQEKKNPNTQPLRVFLCALSLEGGAPWSELKIHSVFAKWKEKLGYTYTDTMDCFHIALDLGFLGLVDGDEMKYDFVDEEFSIAFQDMAERMGFYDI